MNNGIQQFEQRLERLEKEIEALKCAMTNGPGVPWWEQIVGEFKGDRMFAEIARKGRQIRRGKRKETR